MQRKLLQIKETIATIIAEEEGHILAAEGSIRRSRAELEDFILGDPFFKLTFEPYRCPASGPEIVKNMCLAAEKTGVGPMAAVAGAIAQIAVRDMVEAGARYAIVDNGGDIALLTDRPVKIGIYTGESAIRNIGFELQPMGGIYGVCTSSGTVGPSISLGNADAATVFASDVALADAAATALGNAIIEDNGEHIESVLDCFNTCDVDGFAVITHNHIGLRGKVPRLIRSKLDYDLISKG